MSIDLSQFHQTFMEESFEGLDAMESSLLILVPGSVDEDTINTIFRAAHSIKGGSSTFGFNDVASFTHVLETLLDQIRSGQRTVVQEDIDLLLQSVDCVREMLAAEKGGNTPDMEHITSVQTALGNALSKNQGSEGIPAQQSAKSENDKSETAEWRISFTPEAGLLRSGNDPARIIRELESLGEISVALKTAGLPGLREMEPTESYLSWVVHVKGDVSESDLREVFDWVIDECDLDISRVELNEASAQVTAVRDADQHSDEEKKNPARGAVKSSDQVARKSSTETGSIRVGIDKVDELINMVGELVITQSMLGELGRDFDMAKLDRLRDGLGQLERNTRELQESVMRIRMMPISFAFNRFPRLVHDLSTKLGKKVELKMSGEQTELDKTVMEKIGDPLVHLVRNSLDHGIEIPEIRKSAGKPETGMLMLNAYHKGGNIVIEISDDGAGLNKEKIINKARAKGIINDDETLSDEKIYDLIFQPGFSTADVVSDVSGRGVGMDVVRRNIRELGGAIEITSRPGKGSTITIRLPLTLAIMDGQLVRVGNETYIIPIVSIIESLQAKKSQINAIVDKAEVYKLREEYISILRLYELFNLSPDSMEIAGGLLVVVEADGRKVGLFVDELLGQQQVVIKSLETNYKRVEGISGATILGDGTVAMILDIPGLISLSRIITRPEINRVA